MRISVIEGGLAAFALCAVSAFASEIKIPKNGAEDTQGIMAKSYWEQWNGDLNSDIDRDIEANRKASNVSSLFSVYKSKLLLLIKSWGKARVNFLCSLTG